jgi:proteic killer suppression protein
LPCRPLYRLLTGKLPYRFDPKRETNRRFTAISRVALRKLIQMNRARVLQDLAVPPGNRLEALKGNLAGYHSIRINDQWRIVFAWNEHGPTEVTICDYH